jgi:hypothetical protein
MRNSGVREVMICCLIIQIQQLADLEPGRSIAMTGFRDFEIPMLLPSASLLSQKW